MNIKVETAENGKEATERVQCESFDLVFMDLRMPIMDGLQACIFIKNVLKNENLKIAGLSASVYDYSTTEVQNAKFDDFLLKPFKTEEIIGCMDKLLKLEWENKDQKLSTNPPHSIESKISKISIPKSLYIELKDSAEDFNLTRFSEALRNLEQTGMAGADLAIELKKLLKIYDFISIQNRLEEISIR